MERRMLPLLFMLISGAITCIATWIQGYSALEKLIILLIVMLIFGALGAILKNTINYFDKQNQKKKEEAEKEAAEKEAAEKEAAGQTEKDIKDKQSK